MEDGTFQMHLHMMSGINHRNVRVLAVDATWNTRDCIKVCYNFMLDLSLLSTKGGDLRTLLSDTGGGGSNIFDVTHTYLQRATNSLRDNGSLHPMARDLNLHLPRTYAEWLVKKQGYMTIHPMFPKNFACFGAPAHQFLQTHFVGEIHLNQVQTVRQCGNSGSMKQSPTRWENGAK